MPDPRFIRENAEIVKQAMEKRGMSTKLVDTFLDYDTKLLKVKKEIDNYRHKRNEISLSINNLIKQKKDKTVLKKEIEKFKHEAKGVDNKLKQLEPKLADLNKNWKTSLMSLPNLLADDVPIGKGDVNNKVVNLGDKPKKFNFNVKPHADLARELGADTDRAAKVAGSRFYYLKGKIVKLAMALENFVTDFLMKKDYTLVEPPFMLNRKAYEGCTDLGAFEDVLYKIEGEDLYMIATAEHPMAAYYMDEIVDVSKPIKFAGISPCFRKEAGSHGKDTKGIFRVHQFDKIEQFIFCKPEDAEKMHKELLNNIQDIMEMLGLPWRSVIVCSGEMGKTAFKQYDIESYFPSQKQYRELASCSNCTDWQARRLNIKYDEHGKKNYVYTLNATALAVQRTITAILENYQQKDGSVVIPKVLQKYCGFDKLEPEK